MYTSLQPEATPAWKLPAIVLSGLACAVSAACQPADSSRQLDRTAAMDAAHRLHEELNRLEVAGQLDEQAKYFAENVVRLDPNRAPSKGRDAFLSYARTMQAAGYRAQAAATTVIDAWSAGNRLVEYGTTVLRVSFDGAAAVEDPVNYLAVWRINPEKPMDAQLETIIWNAQKPLAELEKLGGG